MKRFICTALLFTVLFAAANCGNRQSGQNSDGQTKKPSVESTLPEDLSIDETKALTTGNENSTEENAEMKMQVKVGRSTFTATLENNAAADALAEMMGDEPVTIQMSDYSGFEKVGELGRSLPVSNSQITAEAGDIVLYQGNQIVLFYGSNSWSYTRLGRIDDLTGWEEALGSKEVTVTFSLE